MTPEVIEEIIRLYVVDQKSTHVFARIFDTSHTTIRRILKANGVKMRSHVDAALPQVRYNTCVMCGKTFRACNTGEMRKLSRKCCSDTCFRELMRNIQLNNQNSNWKGGHSQGHYQRIRRETKEEICEWCGKIGCRLDTHHKDRNKANNSLDNIMVLCVSCHAYLHYIEDERGLNGRK